MVLRSNKLSLFILIVVLSFFEKYNYFSTELTSRMLKIFIASFINTVIYSLLNLNFKALVILLVNLKLKDIYSTKNATWFKLFSGKYQDLTPVFIFYLKTS